MNATGGHAIILKQLLQEAFRPALLLLLLCRHGRHLLLTGSVLEGGLPEY